MGTKEHLTVDDCLKLYEEEGIMGLVKKVKEISFKVGIREAIRVYAPYIKALEEENGSLVGFAWTHGWRSSQVESGEQCRRKIKELKAKGKPN